jgi:hypothetical protein
MMAPVHHVQKAFDGTKDVTLLSKQLERKILRLGLNDDLRPTILKTVSPWKRSRQATLLSAPKKSISEVIKERTAAIILLDAISRSGAIPVDHADLHVFVAATQCFDNGILATIVQDNINPIEKVERSTLLLASAIHNSCPIKEMIQHPSDIERIRKTFPEVLQEEQPREAEPKN